MTDHRRCESCGGAMPNRTHRKRDKDGRLVCDSCSDNLKPVWGHYVPLNLEERAEMQRREAEAIVSVLRVSSLKEAAEDQSTVYVVNVPGQDNFHPTVQWDESFGKWVCSGDGGRYATGATPQVVLRTIKNRFGSETTIEPKTGLKREAHDSGDGALINHCFAGETEYLTRDGVRTLAETVGTTQQVLTSQQGEKSPRWVDAEIVDFGVQPLMKVTLKRNQMTKVVYATAGHRWLEGRTGKYRVVTTENLKPEHRLASLLTPGVGDLKPDHAGIRHGVIFGDGTVMRGRWARVTLWGEKDKELLPYFPGTSQRPMMTPNGISGVSITGGFTGEMKTVPSLDHTDEYLYGWLAGYFAADGHVNEQGQAIIDSANIDNLYAIRDVATRLGISVYSISTRWRQGYGDEPREISRMQFVGSTLNEDFFLIEKHRDKFRFSPVRERVGWTVVSVEETERVERVYCAVVPETESFVLADNLWTMNCPFCGSGAVTGRSDGSVECDFCNSVFTVQVQPPHPNMPQTVDGQPVTPPGMPAGQDTELSSTDDPSVAESEDGVAANPLDDDDPTKPKKPNPFAKGGDPQGSPPAGDKSKPNPFAKKDDGGAKKPDDGGKKKSLPPWMKNKKSRLEGRLAALPPRDINHPEYKRGHEDGYRENFWPEEPTPEHDHPQYTHGWLDGNWEARNDEELGTTAEDVPRRVKSSASMVPCPECAVRTYGDDDEPNPPTKGPGCFFCKGQGEIPSDRVYPSIWGPHTMQDVLDRKKKSLLTSTGASLPVEDYMAHLALTFADDREAVLDTVRVANVQRQAAHPDYPHGVPYECLTCGNYRTKDHCATCEDRAENGKYRGPTFVDYLMHGLLPSGASASKTAVGEITCPECNGLGQVPPDGEDCPLCYGEGMVMWSQIEVYRAELEAHADESRAAAAALKDLNQRYPRQGARG